MRWSVFSRQTFRAFWVAATRRRFSCSTTDGAGVDLLSAAPCWIHRQRRASSWLMHTELCTSCFRSCRVKKNTVNPVAVWGVVRQRKKSHGITPVRRASSGRRRSVLDWRRRRKSPGDAVEPLHPETESNPHFITMKIRCHRRGWLLSCFYFKFKWGSQQAIVSGGMAWLDQMNWLEILFFELECFQKNFTFSGIAEFDLLLKK